MVNPGILIYTEKHNGSNCREWVTVVFSYTNGMCLKHNHYTQVSGNILEKEAEKLNQDGLLRKGVIRMWCTHKFSTRWLHKTHQSPFQLGGEQLTEAISSQRSKSSQLLFGEKKLFLKGWPLTGYPCTGLMIRDQVGTQVGTINSRKI